MTDKNKGTITTGLPHVCAVAVAVAFLVAASLKIWDPFQFKTDINNYHILPRTYANLFAIVLPGWEAAAAVALIRLESSLPELPTPEADSPEAAVQWAIEQAGKRAQR